MDMNTERWQIVTDMLLALIYEGSVQTESLLKHSGYMSCAQLCIGIGWEKNVAHGCTPLFRTVSQCRLILENKNLPTTTAHVDAKTWQPRSAGG